MVSGEWGGIVSNASHRFIAEEGGVVGKDSQKRMVGKGGCKAFAEQDDVVGRDCQKRMV